MSRDPEPAGRSGIDALRDAAGHLDRDALLKVLPYGEDFLFVDRVTRLESGVTEGSFTVPPDAPFLRSHFRDLPVMPGALIAEGWAQTGTLLVRYHLERPETKTVVGMQIERTRFDGAVAPGDSLRYVVRLAALDSRAARLEGEALTERGRVAKLKVVVGIVDTRVFRARLGG